MIQDKRLMLTIFTFLTTLIFILNSCSNLPLIGSKKKEKEEKIPAGKTVTVEGMETIKGVNPPREQTSASKKSTAPATLPRKETETKVASTSARPLYSPSLPIFQVGFRKKVAILDFENNTTYKEEKIAEAVAKKLSDKLEATQRVVTLDKAVVSEM